ncbi:hypothetical protein LCGC14_0635970 [marine sediment metagenome]|uniref:Uncharacterized protein n=1 Tax=marine sediment metagenome TaxID=412755 RepID=A0A0F9R5S7_9ZZZZ
MMENKAFKIAGIKNLIEKNYKLPSDQFDLESLIDDTLGMSENWHNNIKEKVKRMIPNDDLNFYEGML